MASPALNASQHISSVNSKSSYCAGACGLSKSVVDDVEFCVAGSKLSMGGRIGCSEICSDPDNPRCSANLALTKG
jgi:hypothetical protein